MGGGVYIEAIKLDDATVYMRVRRPKQLFKKANAHCPGRSSLLLIFCVVFLSFRFHF